MTQQTNVDAWASAHPMVVSRGIDEATWSALTNSIYPGAKEESVLMAIDYCRARHLDPLMKPVHLVPMSVKDSKTGNYALRDVVMPGVGLYRIQADRSGNYAGAKEPEFGPDITTTLDKVEVTFPSWCKYTVNKVMPNGVIVEFSAKEYWMENYATKSNSTAEPNAMWKKRPYGQLAKCAEAQALRKAWPEIGQQATAEEMEGKTLEVINESEVVSSRKPGSKFNDIITNATEVKEITEQTQSQITNSALFDDLAFKLSESSSYKEIVSVMEEVAKESSSLNNYELNKLRIRAQQIKNANNWK